jgi:uncharacterized protein YecE (DUF72 family)
VGYIRLHGRNYHKWFSRTANVRERYDYLYSPDELEPWVARVKHIAEDAEETYAVTNNHSLGKSTVNALELQAFLHSGPVKVPPVLQEHCPELRDLALRDSKERPAHD